MEHPYADRYWRSEDGLKLYFRDYPAGEGGGERGGGAALPPVLCLHGLTRNSRDFDALARHLSHSGPSEGDGRAARRVLAPDFRGRGESAYAARSASYNPAQYVADIAGLLAAEGIARVVAVGTSLGGIVTMLLAQRDPGLIAGAVLNDVGPVLREEGLEKIRGYVGQGRSFPTWMHAARALKEVHEDAHPGFTTDDWLAMAKRTMVLLQNGRISYDYDMAIADPFREAAEGPAGEAETGAGVDLWPAFEALAGRPLLLVRGALSNLLAPEAAAGMARRHPGMAIVTIQGVGHAPLLDEPDALAAIDALVARAR